MMLQKLKASKTIINLKFQSHVKIKRTRKMHPVLLEDLQAEEEGIINQSKVLD